MLGIQTSIINILENGHRNKPSLTDMMGELLILPNNNTSSNQQTYKEVTSSNIVPFNSSVSNTLDLQQNSNIGNNNTSAAYTLPVNESFNSTIPAFNTLISRQSDKLTSFNTLYESISSYQERMLATDISTSGYNTLSTIEHDNKLNHIDHNNITTVKVFSPSTCNLSLSTEPLSPVSINQQHNTQSIAVVSQTINMSQNNNSSLNTPPSPVANQQLNQQNQNINQGIFILLLFINKFYIFMIF